MTLEEAVGLTTLGDVFTSSEEPAIKLPRLLDAALERLRQKGTHLSSDDRGFLRRLVIERCKPGGDLTATNQGIMRVSDYYRKYGSPPPGPLNPNAPLIPLTVVDREMDAEERERMVSFFRTSRCDNSCSKCGAPLPCRFH